MNNANVGLRDLGKWLGCVAFVVVGGAMALEGIPGWELPMFAAILVALFG